MFKFKIMYQKHYGLHYISMQPNYFQTPILIFWAISLYNLPSFYFNITLTHTPKYFKDLKDLDPPYINPEPYKRYNIKLLSTQFLIYDSNPVAPTPIGSYAHWFHLSKQTKFPYISYWNDIAHA